MGISSVTEVLFFNWKVSVWFYPWHSGMENVWKKGTCASMIHFNVKCLLPMIDDIHYPAKLTNDSAIGLSNNKLDSIVLTSKVGIEGYDLVRFNGSWREWDVACYLKNSFSYNCTPIFRISTETFFLKIFFQNLS